MPMKEIVDADPVLRKRLYTGYGVAGTVLGAIEVAYLAVPEDSPVWLRVALAVYLFLGTAFGFGARSKVDATPIEAPVVQPVVLDGTGAHRAVATDEPVGVVADESGD